MNDDHSKVTSDHLKRKAYLYIRQSTFRQLIEHTESTKRQYDFRQRAVSLGWPQDDIVVIDMDLGQSAASKGREGFQKLVTEVGMGRVGIVLGLEASRLARNSMDWHHLLEICSYTSTLILDEDGLYDPSNFNDRLLLGLKGTMSEAELHFMRARLTGGLMNKARRGELAIPLPIGLAYDAMKRVVLDSDRQVQESVRLLFQTYLRTGAAYTTAKHFHQQHLQFPRRLNGGPHHGEIVWSPLNLQRIVSALHNPRYAGAFAFGRKRSRKGPGGRVRSESLPQDKWHVLIPDLHPGYITWSEYQLIQQRLRETARAYGSDRRHGPPREGPALLQGLLLCGKCGRRMTLRYQRRKALLLPTYFCQRRGMAHAEPLCTSVPGAALDAAVANLLLETVSPMAIEVALDVQHEVHARLEQVDRLRRQQVEREQYEADLARRRYIQVDPANRLVADSLEAEWNARLRALEAARQTYERESEQDRADRDGDKRERFASLAGDFAALWKDPRTPHRERKRMARLILEDVTLVRDEQITLHVRFRGGATTSLTLPRPRLPSELRATDKSVIKEIDTLLDEHTCSEVVAALDERGRRTSAGFPFRTWNVKWIMSSAKLRSLKERLRAAGWRTISEVAHEHGVSHDTVRSWRRQGRLQSRRCNDLGEWLYFQSEGSIVDRQGPVPPPPALPFATSDPGSIARGAV